MEKNKVEQAGKTTKRSLSSNPIATTGKNPLKDRITESVVQKIVSTPEKISNPIRTTTSGLVAKINNLNKQKTTNGYKTNSSLFPKEFSTPVLRNKEINYTELMQDLYTKFQKTVNIHDLFTEVHKTLTETFNCNFTAFGMLHEKSKCINLKLHSKKNESFSSKILLSNDNNPIVRSFKTTSTVSQPDITFLDMPYGQNSPAIIIPMSSVNKCIGIMILGKDISEINVGVLELFANYFAIYLHNQELLEKTKKFDNTDTLTSLYNHRGFQEVLSSELANADSNGNSVSIVMLDVNNISKINRELGHAKGDEVIKILAEKVKQNIRPSDKAGRYGGDEIAIILPNTGTADAKYLAEYITYCLSCCFVDDVGPVKVSVGISTYPENTKDQEKLLILAEQAMYISQAKGYKEGMSAIVSSSDYDFWDDVALSSFAEILAKRHAQIGINFEEELLHQFNSEEIKSHNHLFELATSLAGAIDAKDPYTKDHSSSVSRYSEALARAINLPENEVERIKLGALLHDVGKIGIPEQVLKKPEKLSDEEWEIMKQHPTIGAEKVLEPNEALRDLIPIVKYHHERIDGKGYPENLVGDKIPLAAKIVSVADAYHALISDRPYRKGMSIDKACTILKDGAGKQWDSDLVRHFISIAPALSV